MGDIQKTGTGKQGPIKGSTTSSEGPQFPHLPSANSYSNGNVKRRSTSTAPGDNRSSKGPQFPHLPKKPK